MNITLLKGYPDFVGKRQTWTGFGNGPASYVKGGDPINLPQYGAYIDVANGGSQSVSGNYSIVTSPAGVGPRQVWKAKWLYAGGQIGVDGVAIATAGSGQTNGTFIVNASAGNAQIQITIAGGALTAVSIVTPGSGYITAPTFTVAEGGTPGTIGSVTLGLANGAEVAAATNLSAESIQLGGLCGQY